MILMQAALGGLEHISDSYRRCQRAWMHWAVFPLTSQGSSSIPILDPSWRWFRVHRMYNVVSDDHRCLLQSSTNRERNAGSPFPKRCGDNVISDKHGEKCRKYFCISIYCLRSSRNSMASNAAVERTQRCDVYRRFWKGWCRSAQVRLHTDAVFSIVLDKHDSLRSRCEGVLVRPLKLTSTEVDAECNRGDCPLRWCLMTSLMSRACNAAAALVNWCDF